MAIIYSAPKAVKLPKDVFQDYENWQKNENDYIERLKSHIKGQGYNGKNSGEIIKFPVADGQAQYMVLQMKPLGLIHLPLGDAWDFQYAHLLTGKEVQQKIDQEKSLAAFFASRKK